LQYRTPKPAAACSWKSSTKRLPYCANGPPCTWQEARFREANEMARRDIEFNAEGVVLRGWL
jgi:hypothetical protein